MSEGHPVSQREGICSLIVSDFYPLDQSTWQHMIVKLITKRELILIATIFFLICAHITGLSPVTSLLRNSMLCDIYYYIYLNGA